MVTKFALQVHLTWMYQLEHSPLVCTSFPGHRGQNVKVKFWFNWGGTNRKPCTQRLVRDPSEQSNQHDTIDDDLFIYLLLFFLPH